VFPDQTGQFAANVAPVTVLVVEPSRVQASIIKGYVQEHSLAVVGTATTGQSAIELVRQLRPRAVISARYLSDMDGVELARRIRSEFPVLAPGFVLVTSESDRLEDSSSNQLNRVLLLAKPFTSGQLVGAIKQVTGLSMPLPPLASGAAGGSTAGGQSRGKASRSQLRVMIVDDSSTARSNIRSVLAGFGLSNFLEVPDGAHAIAVAAQESCHLIVTDYNMPLMDGRALVSYLKQNPATSATPIVMVTSETDPQLLGPVRQLGVVAIIEKAFPASIVGPLLDSLF
jgi:two-component system chemotaxis response regulator CheY